MMKTRNIVLEAKGKNYEMVCLITEKINNKQCRLSQYNHS